MTPATAILLALVLSILLIVFSLGARSTLDDALWLFRRPLELLRAITAIYIVVPAFAVALCLLFDLSPPVRFALVALSVSPLPPILPNKQLKVGGDQGYAISLLIAASLIALVATPLLLSLAGRMLAVEAAIPSVEVAKKLMLTVGAPLAAGMLLRAFAPRAADAVANYAFKAGMLLLLLGVIVILVSQWRAIVSLIGNGSVLAIAATVAVGLLAGHLLAGEETDRGALALAASTRHPGVAISIAAVNFEDMKQIAVAAVLLFLLVNILVSLPYVRWMKRHAATAPAPA